MISYSTTVLKGEDIKRKTCRSACESEEHTCRSEAGWSHLRWTGWANPSSEHEIFVELWLLRGTVQKREMDSG